MISEGKVASCSLGRKRSLATGDVAGQRRALLGCDNGRNWREELQGNGRHGSERGTGWGLVPRPDGRRSKENRALRGEGGPEMCGEDPVPCRRKGAKPQSGSSFFFFFSLIFSFSHVVQAGTC